MKQDSKQLVYKVETVHAKFVALNKVSILINATGKTNTNGWKNPQLIPVVYVQPPADKTWDFSFVAEKPEVANEVLTEVSVSFQWENPPGDVVAVRVIAESNKRSSTIEK